MDLREHSIALISVIVGLGLADLLGNFNRLVRAGREVRWAVLPLVWALVALVLVNNYWWGLYQGYVGVTSAANALTFLLGLGMPIMLYLICAAALPNGRSEAARDLRAAYFLESRYFFALIVLYVLATLVQTVILKGAFQWTIPMLERCLIMGTCLPLLWMRDVRYHWFAAGVNVLILLDRLFEQVLH